MSTEEKKQQFVEYSVRDREIYRKDQNEEFKVADYDEQKGIVQLTEGRENYRNAIIRHLNDKGYKFSEVGFVGMPVKPDELKEKGIPPKPRKNPRLGDKTPAVVEWYARYRPDVFLERFGVREVQHRTGSQRFNKIIRDENGNKVTVKEEMPVYEKEQTGRGLRFDMDAVKRGEQRLIAEAKTHLTVKMNETDGSDEYDWESDATAEDRRGSDRV